VGGSGGETPRPAEDDPQRAAAAKQAKLEEAKKREGVAKQRATDEAKRMAEEIAQREEEFKRQAKERRAKEQAQLSNEVAKGMQGMLLKKTKNGVFHARQFVLTGSELSWVKSDGKTRQVLELAGASIVEVKFATKKFSFEVSADKTVLVLAAADEANKDAWVKAIAKAIGVASPQAAAGRKSVRGVNGRVGEVGQEQGSTITGALTALHSAMHSDLGPAPGSTAAAAATAHDSLRFPPLSPVISPKGMPPPVNFSDAPGSPGSPRKRSSLLGAASSLALPKFGASRRLSMKSGQNFFPVTQPLPRPPPPPATALDRMTSPLTFRILFEGACVAGVWRCAPRLLTSLAGRACRHGQGPRGLAASGVPSGARVLDQGGAVGSAAAGAFARTGAGQEGGHGQAEARRQFAARGVPVHEPDHAPRVFGQDVAQDPAHLAQEVFRPVRGRADGVFRGRQDEVGPQAHVCDLRGHCGAGSGRQEVLLVGREALGRRGVTRVCACTKLRPGEWRDASG
jgi:hypothetical protein